MKAMQLLIFLALVPVLACAQPNYAPAERAPDPGGTERKLTCATRFESGACLGVEWEHFPGKREYGILRFFTFAETDTGPSLRDLGDEIEVVPFMPSMGHGSDESTIVERLTAGTYRATQIYFTMRGAWELRFLVKTSGVIRDRAAIPVRY